MAVTYTPDEQQAVIDEGIRLQRIGKTSSLGKAFELAQLVLPKNRRRRISTTSKVPWFVEPMKAAKLAATADPEKAIATEGGAEAPTRKTAVHWKPPEKAALCMDAARLLLDLQANGPRDAMEKAQLTALQPERRRTIASMASLADWYPEGLQKARMALLRERERETKAAIAAKLKEQEAAAPAPASAPVLIEDQPKTTALATAAASPLALFGDWSRLREHLVQEIASIVAEGIHRGLASVQLAPSQQQQAEPAPVRAHVPFVVSAPKERPPSVLVAGLKDATASQIKAEFGAQLDLRFITPDKSKDQLRQMAEQADTTIAVIDFLSHSHSDIIKARSKHHIESSGGMTHLRQELARLAGRHMNGSAAHAAN
jgi:hypothetical protein